jgi:putative transposase
MLTLSKIGRLRLRLHRPLPGTPKTATISREADGWYTCISCTDVPTHRLPPTGYETGTYETGIAVGLTVLLITAEGDPIANPRHSRRAERALRKAQRQVARRTKGSRRRRKGVQLLARTQQQVKRRRTDFHHTTALALLRQYDVVSLEESQVAKLVRNRPLATRISAAGWAAFRTIRDAKAACCLGVR